MRLPRIARISSAGSFKRSLPAYRISPPAIRPGGDATSRMIDSAVTLLPLPDSLTSPSVPFAGIANDTPSTARATPCSVRNSFTRSRISRTASPTGTLTLPDAITSGVVRGFLVLTLVGGCGRIAFDDLADPTTNGASVVQRGCGAELTPYGDTICVRRSDGPGFCWG